MNDIFSRSSGSMTSFLMDFVNTASNYQTKINTDKIVKNTGNIVTGLDTSSRNIVNGVEQLGTTVMTGLSSLGSSISYGMNRLFSQMEEQIEISNAIIGKLEDLNELLKSPTGVQAREWFTKGMVLLKKDLLVEALNAFCKSNEFIDTNFYTHYQIGLLSLYGVTEDDNVLNLADAEESFLYAARLAKAEVKEEKSFVLMVSECYYHASIACYSQFVEFDRIEKLEKAIELIDHSLKYNPGFPDAIYHAAKYESILENKKSMMDKVRSLLSEDITYAKKILADDDFTAYHEGIRKIVYHSTILLQDVERSVKQIVETINHAVENIHKLISDSIDEVIVHSLSRILWLVYYNAKSECEDERERLGLFSLGKGNTDFYLKDGFLKTKYFENLESKPTWLRLWVFLYDFNANDENLKFFNKHVMSDTDVYIPNFDTVKILNFSSKEKIKCFAKAYTQKLGDLYEEYSGYPSPGLTDEENEVFESFNKQQRILLDDIRMIEEPMNLIGERLYQVYNKTHTEPLKNLCMVLVDKLTSWREILSGNTTSASTIKDSISRFAKDKEIIQLIGLLRERAIKAYDSPDFLQNDIAHYESLFPELKGEQELDGHTFIIPAVLDDLIDKIRNQQEELIEFLEDQQTNAVSNPEDEFNCFREIHSMISQEGGSKFTALLVKIRDRDDWSENYRDLFFSKYLKYIEYLMGFKIHQFPIEQLRKSQAKDLAGVLTVKNEGEGVLFEIDQSLQGNPLLELMRSAIFDNELNWFIGEGESARAIQIPLSPLRYIVVCLDHACDLWTEEHPSLRIVEF